MTVENDKQKPSGKPKAAPKAKPIQLGTGSAINIGETTKFERLPSVDVEEVRPVFHGPPPHVHRYMKKRMKRGCCCLFLLLVFNLLTVAYVARKIGYIAFVLSPESGMAYMPGGTHPFCSDLCVDLCVSSDDDDTTDAASIDCDISDCMDSCANYFDTEDDDSDDDSDDSVTSDGFLVVDLIDEEDTEESEDSEPVLVDTPQTMDDTVSDTNAAADSGVNMLEDHDSDSSSSSSSSGGAHSGHSSHDGHSGHSGHGRGGHGGRGGGHGGGHPGFKKLMRQH